MEFAKTVGISLVLCVALGIAQERSAPQPYALVIAGLGGEPEYDKQFRELGDRLSKALRQAGMPAERVITLPPDHARREDVARAFQAAATRVGQQDPFLVFLIGHGSFDGTEYKMNLPGPDATAADFRQWLDAVPAQRQVVVNATSSSGATVSAWSRAGRVVIAATKTGQEHNATVFMRFFAQALEDPAADQDKNGTVTAGEAFLYAAQRVEKFYESAGRLATEHPQLDDNGDGKGVRDPSPANGEGLLAGAIPLIRLSPAATGARSDTPEARELRARRETIENQIADLKYHKASLGPEEYAKKLEQFLVELARTQQQLDKLDEGSRPK